jgi:hypothetical protein
MIFPLLTMVRVVPVAQPVPVSVAGVAVLLEYALTPELMVRITVVGTVGEPAAVNML